MDKAAGVLFKKFEEGRSKNKRWSQRAFARRLGISSGALSEILKGKRPVSPRLKKRIASRLGLSPAEEVEFFESELPEKLKAKKSSYHRLTQDQFEMISDWWHFAILNLIQTKGFRPSPRWIASRLGLPLKTAFEAWERLFRLGHLERVGAKVVRRYPQIDTSDGIFDLSVRKAHFQDTELIGKSITEIPIELRDHSSITLVLNKADIPKAKELIRFFQDRLADEVESLPGEEVYRLSVSLFPLSKPIGGKE